MRPFDWCQNQRSWMTLNVRYELCCRKDASFGAHHKNLNEDIPIPMAAKTKKHIRDTNQCAKFGKDRFTGGVWGNTQTNLTKKSA